MTLLAIRLRRRGRVPTLYAFMFRVRRIAGLFGPAYRYVAWGPSWARLTSPARGQPASGIAAGYCPLPTRSRALLGPRRCGLWRPGSYGCAAAHRMASRPDRPGETRDP